MLLAKVHVYLRLRPDKNVECRSEGSSSLNEAVYAFDEGHFHFVLEMFDHRANVEVGKTSFSVLQCLKRLLRKK